MEPESPYLNANELFTMLRENQIPHILVSGPALLSDPAVHSSNMAELTLALPDAAILPGLKMENQDEWMAKGFCLRLGVDLLFTPQPFFSHVLTSQTLLRTFHSHNVSVATPKGSLLLKLFALPGLYHHGQSGRAIMYESDITDLLLSDSIPDSILLDFLRPHSTQNDLETLGGVLKDARKRQARPF